MRVRAGGSGKRRAPAEPIAFLYCPLEQGVLEYRYMGYDPDFAELSPGSVLLWQALEQSFADPACRFFDFAGGERKGTEQKRRMATGTFTAPTSGSSSAIS